LKKEMKNVHFTCKYIDSVIRSIKDCRQEIEAAIRHDETNPHLEDAFNALYRLEDQMEDIRSDNTQLRDNCTELEDRVSELEDELKTIESI
jgi:polyhydroxyalkanoate synthesis regulator phasin